MATKKKETVKNGGAVVKATPGQLELPDFMRGLAGQGTETMKTEDVEIPRVVLLQALSPEVQDGEEKPNTFWHTVMESSLGKEIRIVPVYVNQSYILWKPRKMGGGMLARASDGKNWSPAKGEFEVTLDSGKKVVWKLAATVRESGLDAWGSSDPSDPNSQPAATRMYNIAVFMPDFPELSPAVVTLQRSAVKVARKFVGKLMLSQAPSYGMIFRMSGVKDQNSQGQEFFNYRFHSDGLVKDENTFQVSKEMYNYFRRTGVNVKDIDGIQDDQTPGAAAEGDY